MESAARAGVKVYGLSSYVIGGRCVKEPTVVLGYSRLKEEEIKEGIRLLTDAWRPAGKQEA